MNDGGSLFDIVVALVEKIGVWPALGVVLAVGMLPTVLTMFRDRKVVRGYELALQAKEEEIQRLAADNLMWRFHFLQREVGYSAEDAVKLLNGPVLPSSNTANKITKETNP